MTPPNAPTAAEQVTVPLSADDERAMAQKHEPLTKAERNHIISEMDRWGDLWLIQRYEETVLALESQLLAARRDRDTLRAIVRRVVAWDDAYQMGIATTSVADIIDDARAATEERT